MRWSKRCGCALGVMLGAWLVGVTVRVTNDPTGTDTPVPSDAGQVPDEVDMPATAADWPSRVDADAEARSADPSLTSRDFQVPGTVRATPHPHGTRMCASGCVMSNHPTTRLERTEFRELLGRYAAERVVEPGESLERLVYYGSQSRDLLRTEGSGPLDADHAKCLSAELRRRRATVSFRLIDEHGRARAHLPPTSVPLDIRQVFQLDFAGLQPLVASGTVKRVGLHHLWQRI